MVGDLIIARVRGEPTEALLRECQEQVLFLVKDAGRGKVLYDALEMEAPPVDIPWAQRELDEKLGSDSPAPGAGRSQQQARVPRAHRLRRRRLSCLLQRHGCCREVAQRAAALDSLFVDSATVSQHATTANTNVVAIPQISGVIA